jgi:hypothetical protein
MDHDDLIEKLRRIEALHAGATTPGERNAAEAARERILERLRTTTRVEPPTQWTFSLADPWERKLFLALCRRYGLTPYRQYRSHRQTVLLNAPPSFVNGTLWPQFQALAAELRTYLAQVTDNVIHAAIHGDASEAQESAAPQLPFKTR